MFNLPKLTSIGSFGFGFCNPATFFYMPLCSDLGGSVGNNNLFYNISGNTIFLEVDPSCYTSNSGSPDGDIQWLSLHNTLLSPTILFDFYSETYYNNGDSTVQDLSGNGNNGTPAIGYCSGTPTTIDGVILNHVNSPYGVLIDNADFSNQRAIQLPNVANFSGVTPYTVCVWFNSSTLNIGDNQGLVSSESLALGGGTFGWSLDISHPTSDFIIKHNRNHGGINDSDSCNLTFGTDITPEFSGNTWYFVSIGFDGTNMYTSLYANDGNRYDKLKSTSTPLTTASGCSPFLGLRHNEWFNGKFGLMYIDNTLIGIGSTDLIYNGTKGRYGY
jgi:hypothetical protein